VVTTGVLEPRLLVVGYQKPPEVQVASWGPNVQFIVANLCIVRMLVLLNIESWLRVKTYMFVYAHAPTA
jgi:hypothetical protein